MARLFTKQSPGSIKLTANARSCGEISKGFDVFKVNFFPTKTLEAWMLGVKAGTLNYLQWWRAIF